MGIPFVFRISFTSRIKLKKKEAWRLCFAFVSTTTPPNEKHFLLKLSKIKRRGGMDAKRAQQAFPG